MATGKRIRGITIEIDGNTKGLDKALQDVNKRSNTLKGELKDVDRLLKFDPGNVEALAQKQKLLSKQVQTTSERLDILKKAEKEVQDQFRKGKISEEQYRAFKREIEFTEGSLRNLKSELSRVKGAGTDTAKKLKKSFGEVKEAAKDAAKEVGKSVGTLGTAGAVATGALVTGMQEYNQDLARLKANASNAGFSFDVIEDGFKRISAVTGEADSAVETMANLMATDLSESQIAKVIDDINGAAIRFSDTLKSEGIADGLQETLATGEAIGPFAELLERSGVDLEKFNENLAMAKIVGRDTDYVLRELSELGLASAYEEYKALNPEVQANAEANVELQQALADLAIVLTPLVMWVTELITKFANFAEANPKLTKTIVIVGAAIGGLVGVAMALAPIFTVLTTGATALGIGMLPLSGIVLGVIAVIGAMIAIGVLLYKNWDKIKVIGAATWNFLKDAIAKAITASISKVVELKDKFFENIEKIKGFFRTLGSALKIVIPKPKLPKFSIKGKFDLIPPDISVPKISVDWFAKGTRNAPGGLAVVGEEGPELMYVPQGSQIKTASQTDRILNNLGAEPFSINIQNMTVREEADINRIARELFNLMQGSRRKL